MTEPRRLSDKIAAAHEQACAQNKMTVAKHLLAALEAELSSFGGPDAVESRLVDDAIAAAYERHRQLDPSG